MKITVFTDGSSRGNPGPGGYGIIMCAPEHNYRKEFSAGYRLTTNNRMELLAVIVSLENLRSKGHKVDIYSDSKYVVDSVSKGWLAGWVAKGFKDKKNPDLWRRYIEAAKGQYVSFHWIKGHNEHPENERCDALAVAAARPDLCSGIQVSKPDKRDNTPGIPGIHEQLLSHSLRGIPNFSYI